MTDEKEMVNTRPIHGGYMRIFYVFISILVVVFFTSCSISSPEITELQGQNEDNNLSVSANANWNPDKKLYKVEVKIHNKSNKMIQLLFNCNDLISYPGKSYENGCDEVYSMVLEEEQTYFDKTVIPKNLFKIDNDIFNITIRYQLDIDSEKTNDVTVPLKATNK
ncbi:hypothetical protein [Bacillus alkalisoli]|uniref:hypothetical protein n=1 Tax=Bacillus alkalisoli TaxID=2011008 RepID=UPI000C23EE04|nr:hypothetical protein [Bacillus alkalisoli]